MIRMITTTGLVRILLTACGISALCGTVAPAQDVSGDYYDWQKTMQPEKPWHYDYAKTLVMKIHLADRDPEDVSTKVYLRFDQALEVIRKLDAMTLGIPKIVYLTGWQFNGHDSNNSAWNVVITRSSRDPRTPRRSRA